MNLLALTLLAAVVAGPAAAYTQPSELAKLQTLKSQLEQLGPHWCPTPAANSTPGQACDPCGDRRWWGNWDHMACRSLDTAYRFDQQSDDGLLTHFHFSLTGVEGPAATLHDLLCPFGHTLKEWDMKVDALTGTLPPNSPACLPRVEEYDLSRNRLTGTIPASLGDMPVMNQLKLQGNKISGPLPSELGKLRLLEWLRVFDNQMTGTIPAELSALSPTLTQARGRGASRAAAPANAAALCSPRHSALPSPADPFVNLQISIGGNQFEGNLYPFAEAQPQNTNLTYLPNACGMVPAGLLFAAGYDAVGSPGLGLPCADEARGWPDVPLDF
eukprot:scaffold11.g3867.t1